MGIDYGLGQTNIDKETGIRYGVISQHEVLQAWCDDSEAEYGSPNETVCSACGHDFGVACEYGDSVKCPGCGEMIEVDLPDFYEPIGHSYVGQGYQCTQGGDDSDIFILKSPYYTLCDFCSPCAPGAGYLTSEGNVKAYCFGHDWFYDHPEHPGRAPYRVFKVSDDSEVFPEAK